MSERSAEQVTLRDRVDTLANLAAEHMSCSGCPTPWWLVNWLSAEADSRDLPTSASGFDYPEIRCDDETSLLIAEAHGKVIIVNHVCANGLGHAGPLDDQIAQKVWEDAVAEGESWAVDECSTPPGLRTEADR